MNRARAVCAALITSVLVAALWALQPADAGEVARKKAADPVAAAEKTAAKQLKKALKAASKELKSAAASTRNEFRALAKAIRTRKGLDAYVGSPAKAGGPGKDEDPGIDLATGVELAKVFASLFPAVDAQLARVAEEERGGYFEDIFLPFDPEDLPEDFGGGGSGDPFEATDAKLSSAITDQRQQVLESAQDAARALSEAGFPVRFVLYDFPEPAPIGAGAPAYRWPTSLSHFFTFRGDAELSLFIPPTQTGPTITFTVEYLPVDEPDAEPVRSGDPVQVESSNVWRAQSSGLTPGQWYQWVLKESSEDGDCCIDRGLIQIPVIVIDDSGGDPTACSIQNGASITYDIAVGAPMEITALGLDTVTLTSFLAPSPRVIVSTDRQTLYYVELSYFQEADSGASAVVTVDFGRNGVPLASKLTFGPGSPGSSFFSSFPKKGVFIDLASRISPLHQLTGTICLDPDTLVPGRSTGSVGVEFSGEIIDRMGDLSLVVGSVSGRIGHVGRVNVESE